LLGLTVLVVEALVDRAVGNEQARSWAPAVQAAPRSC